MLSAHHRQCRWEVAGPRVLLVFMQCCLWLAAGDVLVSRRLVERCIVVAAMSGTVLALAVSVFRYVDVTRLLMVVDVTQARLYPLSKLSALLLCTAVLHI